MDNNEVLGHLLQVESQAADLVDNAKVEADRRVTEAEKHSRASYDERCHVEREKLEREFHKSKEQAQQRYQEEMEAYRHAVSSIQPDTDRFSALLSKLVVGET
ncbi:MAG: hypothetical protein LBQ69_02730 [Treponema sp.]|jgi:vacuolar-type H+-ATPase subunit H|nr:hypothetical protein [Treponema sp.]